MYSVRIGFRRPKVELPHRTDRLPISRCYRFSTKAMGLPVVVVLEANGWQAVPGPGPGKQILACGAIPIVFAKPVSVGASPVALRSL